MTLAEIENAMRALPREPSDNELLAIVRAIHAMTPEQRIELDCMAEPYRKSMLWPPSLTTSQAILEEFGRRVTSWLWTQREMDEEVGT